MTDQPNVSIGLDPPQGASTEGDPIRYCAALIKEVQERLHVLQRASGECRAAMTAMIAKSRERILRSRKLLHRLETGRDAGGMLASQIASLGDDNKTAHYRIFFLEPDEPMTAQTTVHKFSLGQDVVFSPAPEEDLYSMETRGEITRLLPKEGPEYQYHIRFGPGEQQRRARESQLRCVA